MPSFGRLALWAASLASMATALPGAVKLTDRQLKYHQASKRQQEAAVALGLGDLDVLQLYVLFSFAPGTPSVGGLY